MKRYLIALLLLTPALAQRPALTPPVVRFQDQNGKPLVGGKLYSYQAGTTTPLSTYVDSTTGALNTNPVILDATGSGRVFLGANVYKFVLQDAFGVVQWTADNIAEGMFQSSYVRSVFGRTGAITSQTGDYNCSQITGAICTLPPAETQYYQTVKVAGTSLPQESSLNLITGVAGSINAFTVTSGGSGYSGSPAVTFSGGGCTSQPAASANVSSGAVTGLVITYGGTGCTTPPVAAFTGGGGSGAAGTATLTPLGISCVDNGSGLSTNCTFNFSNTGGSTPSAYTLTDVTTSRTFGGVYQNTSGTLMFISGAGTTGGSSIGQLNVMEGPTSASLQTLLGTATATVSGGNLGFFAAILPGYYYSVTNGGSVSSAPAKWVEITGGGGGGTSGGVTQIIAGSNVTISPTGGTGAVTINATGGGSGGASFPGTNGFVYNTSTSASRTATSADLAALGGIVAGPTVSQAITQPAGTQLGVTVTNPPVGGDGHNNSLAVNSTVSTLLGDTGGANGSGFAYGLNLTHNCFFPGWNWGQLDSNLNALGGSDWSLCTALGVNMEHNSLGIVNGVSMGVNQNANGDVSLLQVTGINRGGTAALSDEGTVILNGALGNGPGSGGTVVTGGQGATTVTLSGANQVGAGRYLIDTSVTPISTTQTLGALTNGIRTVTLGTTVPASTAGYLAGGPLVSVSGCSVDPYNTITFNTATPPAITGVNVKVAGFTGSCAFINGQVLYVTAFTPGSSFSAGYGHAAQAYSADAGTYYANVVATPRVAGTGTTLMTFGVTLASAYTAPGGTLPLATAVGMTGGFIDTFRIVSVGSYIGGIQYFTANLRRPIMAGARISIGGLAGYVEKNTTQGGEFYEPVIGSPTTTTAELTTLQYGRPGALARAGNVLLYPSAQIEAVNQGWTQATLGDHNMPLATGDTVSIPAAMLQVYVLQNNKYSNYVDNPYILFDGVQSNYNGRGLLSAAQGANFHGTGVIPDTGLYSLGGNRLAINGVELSQRVGLGLYLDQPPSDAARGGNLVDAAAVYVDGAFCGSNPTLCPANFKWLEEGYGNGGSFVDYNRTTHVYNFGHYAPGASAVLQEEGVTLCKTNGAQCAFSSLTTTGSSGPATLSGGVLNIPQYSGGTGSGTVNSGTAYRIPFYPATGTTVGPSSVQTDSTGALLGVNIVPTHVFDGTAASNSTSLTTTNPVEVEIYNSDQSSNNYEAFSFRAPTDAGTPVTMGKLALVNVVNGASNNSGDFHVLLRNAGTVTDWWQILHDGGITSTGVTGGDKGAGTINAAGLYINGVAVGTSAGTVSSFSAGNLSPLFTTSVATATSTPALSFALTSQAANYFFAAPNGAAGTPTFRAIVAADIPQLTATQEPAYSGDVMKPAGSVATTVTRVNGTTISTTSTAVQKLDGAGHFVDAVANIDYATPNQSTTGNAATSTTATNLAGGVAGSVPYQSTASTTTFLAPNTTATRQFLSMTSSVPSYGILASGDIPNNAANTTGSSGSSPANALTGTTLASGVVNSSLTSVGTLASGATGAGFTVALGTSTVTGTLPQANSPALTGDVTKAAGSSAVTVNAIESATTSINVSSAAAPTSGQVLTATSSTAATWQTPASGITTLTGDVTAGPGSGSQAATLAASGVTAGSYTSANITVDAKGRVTAAANGTGGGGSAFQANGTALTSSTTINYRNGSGNGGIVVTNPSAGNVDFNLSNAIGTSGATIPLNNTANTQSAAQTLSAAGAASTPALTLSGAAYAGGTATTNFPQLYMNAGAAPTTFSTGGTYFGINAASAFAGNLVDLHLNGGTSLFNIQSTGQINARLTNITQTSNQSSTCAIGTFSGLSVSGNGSGRILCIGWDGNNVLNFITNTGIQTQFNGSIYTPGTVQSGSMSEGNVATVASATTVAPTTPIVIFSGTTEIDTITNPVGTAALIGAAFDFYTSSSIVFGTTGNIATGFTTSANILYHCTYFGTTDAKWRCK